MFDVWNYSKLWQTENEKMKMKGGDWEMWGDWGLETKKKKIWKSKRGGSGEREIWWKKNKIWIGIGKSDYTMMMMMCLGKFNCFKCVCFIYRWPRKKI